jgi:quinol monooxygenase YgiN
MTSSGLLTRLSARSDRDADVNKFLSSVLDMTEQEPDTTASFAVRFGRGQYGIIDIFPDESALQAHLDGPVMTALRDQRNNLFEDEPRVQKLKILADKFPIVESGPDTKGLLLTFKARAGHERDVEEFLVSAQPHVMEEPYTTAWFAIRTESGEYGIFDVFPDNEARLLHLTGHVPRELTKQAFSLIGSVPGLKMVNVTAEKLRPLPLNA